MAQKHLSARPRAKGPNTMDILLKGSFLTKVRGAGKTYRRYFKFDGDKLSFGYSGSKKIRRIRKMMGTDDDHSEVNLSEIQDIWPGPISDIFVKSFSKLGVKEDQCFSIVIGPKHKTLDIFADNKEIAFHWVKGLRNFKKKLSESDLYTQQEVWMRELFRYADKNGDNSLNMKEVISLLKHLNLEVEQEQAKVIFEMADYNKQKTKKGEDCLDIEEFMHFYQLLTKRAEICDLFEMYNYEGKYLDAEELSDFLAEEQNTYVSEEEALKYIQAHESCPSVREQHMMSINGFNSLMNSPVMDVFNFKHREVYQDMTQPISHYWIDSSHNTYLTADQLVGPSAVEAYIRALKRGCRCVELDVYDGPNGAPFVTHGHTFTGKIIFKDIIQAVALYAFEASDYPLILSFENHCSVEQQKRIAQILKTILGDKLYTKPLDDNATCLPSPEELKGYILIKAKKLPSSTDHDEVSDEDEAAEIEDEKVKEDVSKKKKGSLLKLAKELSDLVVICQSVSFKGFEYSRNNYHFKNMSSISERKAMDLAENQASSFVRHNAWQLTRTYPAGTRTDSSNYDPISMWNIGVQICALNYQTPCENMMMYKGLFANNGGCGYVLKPKFLRQEDSEFIPDKPAPPGWKKTLTLTIVSGYQLPKKKKVPTATLR